MLLDIVSIACKKPYCLFLSASKRNINIKHITISYMIGMGGSAKSTTKKQNACIRPKKKKKKTTTIRALGKRHFWLKLYFYLKNRNRINAIANRRFKDGERLLFRTIFALKRFVILHRALRLWVFFFFFFFFATRVQTSLSAFRGVNGAVTCTRDCPESDVRRQSSVPGTYVAPTVPPETPSGW